MKYFKHIPKEGGSSCHPVRPNHTEAQPRHHPFSLASIRYTCASCPTALPPPPTVLATLSDSLHVTRSYLAVAAPTCTHWTSLWLKQSITVPLGNTCFVFHSVSKVPRCSGLLASLLPRSLPIAPTSPHWAPSGSFWSLAHLGSDTLPC